LGEYYQDIITGSITKWYSLILIIGGSFFLIPLFFLLGLIPQDRKSIFVLPVAM